MKKHTSIAVSFLIAAFLEAHASDVSVGFEESEIHRSSIRLSEDGTGVIQGVKCEVCDFSVLKVTADTIAYVNRVQVSPREALATSSANIGSVKFDIKTQEVIEFRFFK